MTRSILSNRLLPNNFRGIYIRKTVVHSKSETSILPLNFPVLAVSELFYA